MISVTEINYAGFHRALEDLPKLLNLMRIEKGLLFNEIAQDSGVELRAIYRFTGAEKKFDYSNIIRLVAWFERVKNEPALHIQARLRRTPYTDEEKSLLGY